MDDDDEGIAPIIIPTTSSKPKPVPVEPVVQPPKPMTAIDVTADDIVPRLTPHNVTDLVLLTMVLYLFITNQFRLSLMALPSPPSFQPSPNLACLPVSMLAFDDLLSFYHSSPSPCILPNSLSYAHLQTISIISFLQLPYFSLCPSILPRLSSTIHTSSLL